MEKIKLIVWDLDETFWQGTISDKGGVEPDPININFIKELTDRGIVNSICSKNDFDVAKEELERQGVWDYFVFPSIDWSPKGERIKQIISDMNLRPVNVLFVDDNKNNLEEAKFFVPELQVALPEELKKLKDDEALKGKDDTSHSRLKQYKILETQTEARKNSSSNEEFLYQSNISVELIEDCSDQLERIHEMIHRNNQLNFTKDRISKEEVDRIFTDPEIRSGIVHVTDKYGDHGIIGCYAVKDNKALQFVFSCRILGMGVEQWVYAELDFPEIEVVGEVASELKKDEKPKWINQSHNNSIHTGQSDEGITKKLIVYGHCPLRPVWAYLEPKLKNAYFALISPSPSVCNLAVMHRMTEETKNYLLNSVKVFDAEYTFDSNIYSDETDAILVTLDTAWNGYRYHSKFDDIVFYTHVKLTEESADKDILTAYQCEPITYSNIEDELDYLLNHISENTRLFLQTVSEVVFPGKGKDENYKQRVAMNEIATRLAQRHDNLVLIDIRKYANSPMDFFEYVSIHYNRDIGFKLANEILHNLAPNSVNEEPERNNINNHINEPENTIRVTRTVPQLGTVSISSYIRNFEYVVNVYSADIEIDQISYQIFSNRYLEHESEFTDSKQFYVGIHKAADYMARIHCVTKDDHSFTVQSGTTSITRMNYGQFIDPHYSNYQESVYALKQFNKENALMEDINQSNIDSICELAALGINFVEYFSERNIDEIVLFTDRKMGRVILPFFANSSVRIKQIYTVDNISSIRTSLKQTQYSVKNINGAIDVDSDTHVLLAADKERFDIYHPIFRKKTSHIHYLHYILNALKTKKLFVDRFAGQNAPKVFAVRCGNMQRSIGMPYTYVTPNEKLIEHKFRDDLNAYKEVEKGNCLPPSFGTNGKEILLETLKRPKFIKTENDIQQMKDQECMYFSIKNGFRVTKANPTSYKGTIYVFGTITALGMGVTDDETISSSLQKILDLPYRVLNYGNCIYSTAYQKVLDLLFSIEYKPEDIIILLIPHWRVQRVQHPHWIEWDAMEDPISKIDLFPLFANGNRPDYFIFPMSYNAKGNYEVAKILKNHIVDYISKKEARFISSEDSSELQILMDENKNLHKKVAELEGKIAYLTKTI